ncbi:MAG: hypothetical protein QF877_08065 [Gammaproteobacteria bacterium]|jgi:hypothetical protein|nr:hypothetical protein [Gammaproteobacteria bacterium]|tara:strand:+ start:228 stop:401 length:174 start_codon:yes stop_codon:yes gene_type:complete
MENENKNQPNEELTDADNSLKSKNSSHANVQHEGKGLRFFALASAVITLLLTAGLLI